MGLVSTKEYANLSGKSVQGVIGALSSTASRSRLLTLLKPMENGPREMRALDGLRAVAALSIVLFHVMLFLQLEYQPWSQVINHGWYYLSTGVHLFFVLSGFLLFLPYVRALLDGEKLPSARRFYRRRALRILPAYLVCLAAMVALTYIVRQRPFSFGDVATHAVLIHDAFPQYNRDYDGPFWTMAVEAQFYVLLPLMALVVAWVCHGRRSPWRIAGGILLVIAGALTIRLIDTQLMASLPANSGFADSPQGVIVLATMGMQGKYLEVFAVGMFCALLYVLTIERRTLPDQRVRQLGLLMLAGALICMAIAIPKVDMAGLMVSPGAQWGADVIGYPLLVGLGFGGLVLAILWCGRWLRMPFEFAPMRTIGLFSYSLYLWHLPIIHGDVPIFKGVSLFIVVPAAFLIAYLSYQFVERPFLRRRHRQAEAESAKAPSPDEAIPAPPENTERNPAAV
jgi:peptidoglycan/LPS O-acetylase OafA/YrhL